MNETILLRVSNTIGLLSSGPETTSPFEIARPLKSRGSSGIVDTGEKKFALTPTATP
jgi:hypothetical protein